MLYKTTNSSQDLETGLDTKDLGWGPNSESPPASTDDDPTS